MAKPEQRYTRRNILNRIIVSGIASEEFATRGSSGTTFRDQKFLEQKQVQFTNATTRNNAFEKSLKPEQTNSNHVIERLIGAFSLTIYAAEILSYQVSYEC